ncbi:helix-turn-helix transcriptional regulator [Roseinatronobacter sp. S2]|uniref:helix-turn-helix transcriptional regulator n=1 Tax=Roseinatronobacter sp. S2 TaxID=3035471 RepID=UPI00240EC161|nr:helix-turn-helix transcriptional regulator [Roseinatronobacter sp. S2]WFE77025.1 helix-turn-helix transcriptional regulator [Roseinatronobacter sp. S2]
MGRTNSVFIGIALILLVAFGKTALVSTFFLDELTRTGPVLLLLYLIFTLLTGLAIFVIYRFFGHLVTLPHDSKSFSTPLHEPGKENVVEMHARDWGRSKAETDVAILVVKGFSNAEIAKMRGSVLSTVKSQLGSIYQKSGLENRYQLIAFVTDEVCDAAKATQSNQNAKHQRALLKVLSTPDPEENAANVAVGPSSAAMPKKAIK